MTTCKAYLIDATQQTITEVSYDGLEALQKLVGGHIELAHRWPTGDVLYVDEEGLYKQEQVFFSLFERMDQPLAGNGVLVGREIGETALTEPPKMTLDSLRRRIAWEVRRPATEEGHTPWTK